MATEVINAVVPLHESDNGPAVAAALYLLVALRTSEATKALIACAQYAGTALFGVYRELCEVANPELVGTVASLVDSNEKSVRDYAVLAIHNFVQNPKVRLLVHQSDAAKHMLEILNKEDARIQSLMRAAVHTGSVLV
jgi:DNA-binding phage protein